MTIERAGTSEKFCFFCWFAFLTLCVILRPAELRAQADCETGNGTLDSAPPKTMSAQDVVQKLGAAEAATKAARLHYTYRQDVLMQTLSGKDVTGEFHEVTTISYDEKGRRQEAVTFAAQNTLRALQLTANDLEDVRTFMPLILTSEDLQQYKLDYQGQQHVDDLDTYQFRVEPKKKDEKGQRYFEGRIWVDAQDFQMVKVCGKSGPDKVQVKKRERPELHPAFVTYRQLVDGRWFPAYTRVDETLQFKGGAVHMKEIVKYSGYKRGQ